MALAVGSAKRCATCKEVKALADFHRNKTHRDGLHSDCKPCVSARGRAWREANPEKKRAQKARERQRGYYLSATYGMTLEQYEELLAQQDGACAICGGGRTQSDRRLAVDHCHESGEIRGILCHHCNTGLGNFRDNPDFLARAIAYLSK